MQFFVYRLYSTRFSDDKLAVLLFNIEIGDVIDALHDNSKGLSNIVAIYNKVSFVNGLLHVRDSFEHAI